jgi:hypothetical protein
LASPPYIKYRLKELENRMLKRIFGPNREEIIGWRKNCKIMSFTIFTHGVVLR